MTKRLLCNEDTFSILALYVGRQFSLFPFQLVFYLYVLWTVGRTIYMNRKPQVLPGPKGSMYSVVGTVYISTTDIKSLSRQILNTS